MFNCENAHHEGKRAVGPRISPFLAVIASRERSYPLGQDVEGMTLPDSVGSEIVRELRVCPTCFGVEAHAQPVVDLKMFDAIAASNFAHVTACSGRKKTTTWSGDKKTVTEEECKLCKKITASWAEFPAPVLNRVLTEPKSPGPAFSLVMVASSNMESRSFHETKRTERDIQANYAVFGPYISRGGKL